MMTLDLFSFIFGIVFTLAVVIVIEHLYGKLFGNKKLHRLEHEVKRLNKVLQKKDELVKKSLLEMQERTKQNEE